MILTALCAALPLTSPVVLFQDGEAQVDVQRTKTPVEVVVGPVQVQEPDSTSERIAPTTPLQGPITSRRNDGVPLPIPAVFEAGADGDVMIRPASGDPYFLGFTGGDYYPPKNELIDPLILDRYKPGMDSRPGEFTYAFVMFSEHMTDARLARLEALGCRLLKFHPHYTMKVSLPVDILTDVSVMPFVRWVGQAQDQQKYHPALVRALAETSEPQVNVIVGLFESDLNIESVGTPVGFLSEIEPGMAPHSVKGTASNDQRPRLWKSNGWMQRRLEELGLEVQWYSPRSMSIQGWIGREKLGSLVDLDFVSGLELVPEEVSFAVHNESTPMIMSDWIRKNYPGNTNQAAIAGVMDSGIEEDHSDLNFVGVGLDCTPTQDPWSDNALGGSGHGTHVAGTILGQGVSKKDLIGNAPGLGTWGGTSRLFNLRKSSGAGNNCSLSLDSKIDWFQTPYTDTNGNTTAKPHLINNSWGYNNFPYWGTESHALSLDKAVYEADQVWIFAAGNYGPKSLTIAGGGSAKNVLTVGAVEDYINGKTDPGEIWSSSSRGLMLDGRWKPNVVAPGSLIESCLANNNTGYGNYSGTSMAAPHVSGVVATLVDNYDWLRYEPATTAALLMATAMTKDDQVLTTSLDPHLRSYGAGRVNAYKAHYDFAGAAIIDNAYMEINNSGYQFFDFKVPGGTKRLVAVMHYVEEESSWNASKALVNDYDLYLDKDPIDTNNGNTGDFVAHISQVNNTEICILDDPQAGDWRWKVYPKNAGTKKVKLSVVIYAIFDATTTDATLTVNVDDYIVQPGDLITITAEVDPDDYIASAVVLELSDSGYTLVSSSTTTYDGVVTDLGGRSMLLGDTIDFAPRTGTWGIIHLQEGIINHVVSARSDNMVNKGAAVNITVDGTRPGPVSNLTSSSHSPGIWSNNPFITWTWDPATDALSGLQGYGIFESSLCASPGGSVDIGDVTTYTGGPYSSSNSDRAFNIQSVDNAYNWEAGYTCDEGYLIDVDNPPAPTFNSSSHTIGGKSCNPTITVNWNDAVDAHSGVQLYEFFWSNDPTDCGQPVNWNVTFDTFDTETLTPGIWYLHISTKDNAGNLTDCPQFAHIGPFTIVSSCTLFSDDFESGGYVAGGWASSSAGRCKVTAKAAFTGAFGARLKKGGQGTGPCTVGVAAKQTWIQAPAVDTTGWSGVRVDMNAHFRKNTLSCEYMDLQWWDGAAWQSAGIVEAHPWAAYSFNLPAGALGNPALSLRLITNSKGKSEKAELDDFAVIGIE